MGSDPEARSEITVLIVDDDEAFHRFVTPFLTAFRVLRAHNGWEGVEILARSRVDVVLLDLNLPDAVGLRVLENIRTEGDETAVIVVSGYADHHSVQRASTWGARVVLDKTYENCRRLPWHIREVLANPTHRGRPWDPHRPHHRAFVRLEQSTSVAMQRLLRAARTAARSLYTGGTGDTGGAVLVEGEPGSDRQLIGRYIHACAGPGAGPFVTALAAPGAELAASLFGRSPWDDSMVAAADGGVLFLDQVHRLDAQAQDRLWHLLSRGTMGRGRAEGEDRPVHVRIIAGTTADLDQAVRERAFAADLHAALAGTRLRIPPLRERRTDMATELAALVEHTAASMGVAPPRYGEDVVDALLRHPFPGNEQELRAMVAGACARRPGQRVTAGDLVPGAGSP